MDLNRVAAEAASGNLPQIRDSALQEAALAGVANKLQCPPVRHQSPLRSVQPSQQVRP